MATIHVLNHHRSHGLKIHVPIPKKISRWNKRTCMGVYRLELVMDPVELTSCTLNLVQNVGSFLGVNIDTLTPHPQTYEIV
jgi:hypothetical protein